MELKFSSEELTAIEQKEELLKLRLESLGSLVVAYSGGVDSSLLAFYAKKVLKENSKIAIAVSSSLATDALIAARAQAEAFNWQLEEIETDEVDLPQYQKNDGMRCFFCKATLFAQLTKLAKQWKVNYVASGANIGDLNELRPGHMAADQFKVVTPLVDSGLSKKEIRYLARTAGLFSWDRPQDACLASRIATNIPVTIEKLSRVESAEAFVRSLGFNQVRVRHFEDDASVEVGFDELSTFEIQPELKDEIEKKLLEFGFNRVKIDPKGYRTGSVATPALRR